MNKKISFLLVILIILSFTGCGILESFNQLNEDDVYIEKISKEIVRCFDEKDVDGLKSLFCQNTQDNYNLDEEIQNAFDLYEGKSKSYIITEKSWAGGKDDGEWTDKHFNPKIKNIETEKSTYSIGYYVYEIYQYDNRRIGIGAISFYDSQDNEIAGIGGWGE